MPSRWMLMAEPGGAHLAEAQVMVRQARREPAAKPQRPRRNPCRAQRQRHRPHGHLSQLDREDGVSEHKEWWNPGARQSARQRAVGMDAHQIQQLRAWPHLTGSSSFIKLRPAGLDRERIKISPTTNRKSPASRARFFWRDRPIPQMNPIQQCERQRTRSRTCAWPRPLRTPSTNTRIDKVLRGYRRPTVRWLGRRQGYSADIDKRLLRMTRRAKTDGRGGLRQRFEVTFDGA